MNYFCKMNEGLAQKDFSREFVFTATRSSGPGGQNVNKVSTRVELRFDIGASSLLNDEEKTILFEKLANKINAEGELILVCQTERSQLQNKEKVIEKFNLLILRALTPRKKRKATRPTRSSVEERLEIKRQQSEKKGRRRTPPKF